MGETGSDEVVAVKKNRVKQNLGVILGDFHDCLTREEYYRQRQVAPDKHVITEEVISVGRRGAGKARNSGPS